MKPFPVLLPLVLLAACSPPANHEGAERAALRALEQRAPQRALSLLEGDTSAEAERLRAIAALQGQDIEGARKHLEAAVAAGGGARVFADYARLHLIAGEIDGARAMADRAFAADPDDLGTLLTAGEIDARRGKMEAALVKLDRAVALYRGNIAALTLRARVLAELGRWDDLETALAPLREAVPGDPELAELEASLRSRKRP